MPYHSKKKKPKVMMKGGKPVVKMQKSGKFPDLTGDGKVTQADILKGRGVKFNGGGKVNRGDSLPEIKKADHGVTDFRSREKIAKDEREMGIGKKKIDKTKTKPVSKFKKGGKTKKGGMAGLDAAEKQVYRRGLAAYMSSGNRPKVSQHAWAMARVKSAFGKREAAKIRAGKGKKNKK